jgi:hypothetical protein
VILVGVLFDTLVSRCDYHEMYDASTAVCSTVSLVFEIITNAFDEDVCGQVYCPCDVCFSHGPPAAKRLTMIHHSFLNQFRTCTTTDQRESSALHRRTYNAQLLWLCVHG